MPHLWSNRHIMSLLGLDLNAQFLQWLDNDTPPISTFVLSRNKLEAAVAQTAAQLVWIGKESSAVNLFQYCPVLTHSAYVTQRGKPVHLVRDLTLAMGWPIPFRISLHYVLMSVRAAWTLFPFD
jgi:hypothetical protein